MTLEEIKSNLDEKGYSRSIGVDRSTVSEDDMTVELSLSSEEPYERFWGMEILDHSQNSIRLGRFQNGASFRDTHTGDQVAVIEKSWIDDSEKKLRVLLRFSKNTPRAVELFKDIVDGIRKNVSIRYLIHELTLEKEKDGVAWYRVTDWEPIHGSLEPDPADFTVGVGRGAEDDSETAIKEVVRKLEEKLSAIKSENESLINNKARFIMNNENAKTEEKTPQQERERILAINRMAEDFKDEVTAGVDLKKEAESFIAEEKSDVEFQRHVMSLIKEKRAASRALGDVFNDSKDLRNYDIMRAIRAAWKPNLYAKEAGLELEVSKEIAKRTNREAKGIYIPNDFYRDMTAGGSGTGAEFVATDLSDNVLEPLTNRLVATKLGANYISNLSGDFSIPKLTSDPSFVWRATETTSITDSTPATGLLTLTPKFGAAAVDLSDAMLVQSGPDIASLIKKRLNIAKATGIDLAVLHGSGASGQPTGVANTSGVGAVSLVSMDWAAALEFLSDVDTGNALDGNLNYITTPTILATLMGRAKESGYPEYLVSDGKIAGYPVFSTNQVSTGYMFFGNWEHVIIGEWGVTDLVVDPYTGARSGLVQLTLKVMVDVGVEYAAAFSVGSSFS